MRDRQDARLTGASRCSGSSSRGSSGCGSAGLVAAVVAAVGHRRRCMIGKSRRF